MADDWEEEFPVSCTASSFEGRHSGRGRGFIVDNNSSNDKWIGNGHKKNDNNSFSAMNSNKEWEDFDEQDYVGHGESRNQRRGYNNDGGNFGKDKDCSNERNDFGSYGGQGSGRGGGRGGGGSRTRRDGGRDNDDYGKRSSWPNKSDSYNDRSDRKGFGGGRDYENDDEVGDGGNRRGGFGSCNRRGGKGFSNDEEDGDSQGDGGRRGGSGGYDNNNNRFRRGGFNDKDVKRGFGGRQGGFGDDDKDGADRPPPYIPPDIAMDEAALFGNEVTAGINFDKYEDISVKVSGENVPPPIERFDEAGLRQLVLENIRKSGYKKPTPVQKHAIPIIMSGRDLMACAQTGSGKTAAFVVPIINMLLENPTELVVDSSHCEPQVVIVSPTRELTIQIYLQVAKFALGSILKHVLAYGGTSVFHQSRKIANGCHILIATPGRLLDFLNRGRITFSSLRFLVLDEADRMLDMGFLPDIEKMVDHPTMVDCGVRQTLMFSATFPDDVQLLARRFLSNYLFLAVGIVGGACSDVEQTLYEVSHYKKREKLQEIIERESDINLQRTLVFVDMKRTADFIAAFLSENNFPTTSIHGDRLQREREEALEDFRCGRMPILVATDVAARGLDIKDVAHVINYDLPKTISDYVHRIGRTGRVGNRGRATSFFNPEADAALTADLVRILRQAKQQVPSWLECGGGSRTFGPGRSNKFGGEDIRDFAEPATTEPDEVW